MRKWILKGHYPPNTNSHFIMLNCIQFTLHYFQCRISAISLVRTDLFLAMLKTGTCQLTSPFLEKKKFNLWVKVLHWGLFPTITNTTYLDTLLLPLDAIHTIVLCLFKKYRSIAILATGRPLALYVVDWRSRGRHVTCIRCVYLSTCRSLALYVYDSRSTSCRPVHLLTFSLICIYLQCRSVV